MTLSVTERKLRAHSLGALHSALGATCILFMGSGLFSERFGGSSLWSDISLVLAFAHLN